MNRNSGNKHKTISLILFVIAIIVVATGVYFMFLDVKEKTLVCKRRNNYIDDEISVKYTSKEIETISFNMVYDLSNFNIEEFHDLKEDIIKNVSLCRDFKDAGDDFEVVDCKQEINEDIITAVEVLKIKNDVIKKMNINELQDYLTSQDYSCKIEKP